MVLVLRLKINSLGPECSSISLCLEPSGHGLGPMICWLCTIYYLCYATAKHARFSSLSHRGDLGNLVLRFWSRSLVKSMNYIQYIRVSKNVLVEE